MAHYDITVTTNPNCKKSMILMYDSHCYVNMMEIDRFHKRFNPSINNSKAVESQ